MDSGMVLGETLVTGTTAEGPWFECFGDAGTFACQVIQITGSVKLTVGLETKNVPDADTAAVAPTYPLDEPVWEITSTGVSTIRVEDLRQVMRFTYTVAYTSDPPPDVPGFVHFRMLPPLWEDSGKIVGLPSVRISPTTRVPSVPVKEIT